MSPFGTLLRRTREGKGVTLRELEDRTGINSTYISKLETGRMKHSPTRDTILKLAQGLGCNQEETDELLVAARRLPEELENKMLSNPVLLNFFRATKKLSDEDLQNIVKEIERKKRHT